ncbi:hypothetical protein [Acaryochloris sp. IP29b_bin.148]|uniref:hypothetical protein n=1 Tax=Acaryochloris sp. IP29b_bin.148 TaxID=2969218 RepID=UPI00260B8424|nr:hypothetical protein [Acaryochloris sp. IP29b_bin.148]
MYTQLPQHQSRATSNAQRVYDHLLACVRTESPQEVLHRFQSLFLGTSGYQEPEIRQAVNAIVKSASKQEEFSLFFNRCCYILVNRWQTQLDCRYAIPNLIELLGQASCMPASLGRTQTTTRLRLLVKQFVKSAHFQRLRRFSDFINPRSATSAQQPLVTLLQRYPYLYKHCLVSQGDTQEHQQVVHQAQIQTQKRFELELSLYMTDILKRSARQSTSIIQTVGQPSTGRIIQPVYNPTLLSDSDLRSSLKHFVGKVDARNTHQDLAQHFLRRQGAAQSSYKHFKKDLYEYLVASVDTKFGQCRFNNQLHQCLQEMFPESNDRNMNDFLMVRTCQQVFNFLVIESRRQPKHWIFMDLINNIGSTSTISLLLKVVLLCKKVKPYLEKRFALLFSHYETHKQSTVQWLVHCFEKLNLAWCSQFGKFDYSYVSVL